jgi:NADH:ubiquinone oxidoreductase subunit 6 (subunit J)
MINSLEFQTKSIILDPAFNDFFFDFDSIFFFSTSFCFFWGFLILFCGFLACCIDNPIFSVLFLILTFLFSSILFYFLGFPFMSLLIIIIYVGAISVLFLYAVMLYKIRFFDIFRKGYFFLIFNSLQKIFLFFLVLFCSFIFYFFMFSSSIFFDLFFFNIIVPSGFVHFSLSDKYVLTEPEFLGYFLFNDFFLYIIIISYILLIAMCSVLLFTRLQKKSTKFHHFFVSDKLMKIKLKNKYFSSTVNLYYKKN